MLLSQIPQKEKQKVKNILVSDKDPTHFNNLGVSSHFLKGLYWNCNVSKGLKMDTNQNGVPQ